MSNVLLCQGTALHLPMKDASVHCCVTSPPYYGLRSYGIGDGELGLEASPDAYVAAMVQVFREVKRVLRDDGVLFLNLGDSYTTHPNKRSSTDKAGPKQASNSGSIAIGSRHVNGIPAKNLLGMPWRVAFGLQDDGWILRREIIWDKPNCMPESVTDRPTCSHEYVFLFSKQARYHYDAEAIKEPALMTGGGLKHNGAKHDQDRQGPNNSNFGRYMPTERNARSVWRIPSEPFSGAHFATYPPALVRRCLLAGASTQVCAACGAPWKREVERQRLAPAMPSGNREIGRWDGTPQPRVGDRCIVHTTGFAPTCTCAAGTQPATILDPFCGSGTTLLVARELGHRAIGLDLSYPYLATIARERLGLAALSRWQGDERKPVPAACFDDLPLFGPVA